MYMCVCVYVCVSLTVCVCVRESKCNGYNDRETKERYQTLKLNGYNKNKKVFGAVTNVNVVCFHFEYFAWPMVQSGKCGRAAMASVMAAAAASQPLEFGTIRLLIHSIECRNSIAMPFQY